MIRIFVAAVLAASGTGSILYSPAAVWAVLTLQDDWRGELLGPQIAHVPAPLRVLCGATLLLIAFWLWLIDEQSRLYVGLVAGIAAACVVAYWLEHGNPFF